MKYSKPLSEVVLPVDKTRMLLNLEALYVDAQGMEIQLEKIKVLRKTLTKREYLSEGLIEFAKALDKILSSDPVLPIAVPKLRWYGYLHSDGAIQVKRYFEPSDITEVRESDFIEEVHGPFYAVGREEAQQILKDKLV